MCADMFVDMCVDVRVIMFKKGGHRPEYHTLVCTRAGTLAYRHAHALVYAHVETHVRTHACTHTLAKGHATCPDTWSQMCPYTSAYASLRTAMHVSTARSAN